MSKLDSFNRPISVSIILLGVGLMFIAHHAVMSPSAFAACLIFFCALVLSSLPVFVHYNLIVGVVIDRDDHGSIIPSLLEKPPRARHEPVQLEFGRSL